MKKSTFFEELPARKNPVHQPGSPNSAAEGPTGANPKGGTGEEASAKRIRQAVYDIRYRARREEIELEAAYNQYIGNTSMTAPEKASVREKLFGESFDMLGEGKKSTEKQYVIRVKDRAAGTQYWRKATRKKISQLRANPNIGGQGVEMSTYKKPYEEGEKKNKSGKGKVNTKKDVTEAKKGDGNLANNYPPYDQVTRGDIIAGATGKDQMGGKKKKKGMKEEWDSILSDPMLRLVSDAELEATIFDVFEEIEQEGFLTEALEFIDSDQFLTEERDAGAMAKSRLQRKRMDATADGPQSGGAAKRFVAKKARQAVRSGAERVGAAVKKVGSAIKSAGSVAGAKAKAGVKSVAKSAIGAGAKAAGHAVGSYQGARDKARAAASKPDSKPESKPEPPKAASTDTSKSGTTAGSAAAKSSSSSSSDSGSSSSGGGEKKKSFLRRLGGAMKRNLKKAAGKTLRGISTVTDKGAKKLGEEVAPKVKVKSESFDWRSEFFEGLQDNLAPEDEEKINLKKGVKNKVVINPQMEEKQADIEKRINEAKARVEINQMESTIEVDPLKHAVEKAVQERLAKKVNEERTQVSEVVSSLSDRISRLRTEAAEDRLRDMRQQRGGVDGNVDYSRPPAKKATNAELGIKPMTDAQREKRRKEMMAHLKKMN